MGTDIAGDDKLERIKAGGNKIVGEGYGGEF